MRNAYLEVLKSYWDRCWFSAAWALLALVGLMLLVVPLLSRAIDGDGEGMLFLAGLILLMMLAWMHFREQAIHEFRRLLPNYLWPEVGVFSAYSITFVVILPVAFGALKGMSCVSLTAMAVVCFGFIGWWLLTQSWWLLGAVMASSMLLVSGACGSFGPDRKAVHGFFHGSQQGLAVALLAVASAAGVVAVIRMLGMREDDRLYNRLSEMDTWSLRPRMTGEVNQVWRQAQKNRLFGWPGLQNKLVIPAADSLWEGARRWRSVNAGILKFMTVMALMMLFFTWLPEKYSAQQNQSGSTMMICFYLAMMPVLATGQSWMRQWRFLEIELLRPITRQRFLREIALAMGVTVVQCWFVFAAALAFRVVVINSGPINAMALILTLGGSALVQVFLFAAIVWLLRYRSPGSSIGGGFVASIVGLIPILILALPDGIYGQSGLAGYQISAWVMVVVLAGAGWLIARDAWRRWLVTEFG